MYICLTLFTTVCINQCIYNKYNKVVVCGHSLVDTHTGSTENVVTVCEFTELYSLHVLGGRGNVK